MPTSRFELRYGAFRWLLVALGMGPRWSGVQVEADRIRVRMGWAFRADIPRAAVVSAERGRPARAGIGVHGWGGTWLVNGSVHGIVDLRLEPSARARVLGFPVRLRRVLVSLADPDGFVAELGEPAT